MSAIKFKVGDKVKFRDGLEIGEYYSNYMYSDCVHRDLGGKTMTIYRIYYDGYSVEESKLYVLTDEMLEPTNSSEISSLTETPWSVTLSTPTIKLSFL